ncbi:IPT/TIG domain-containing protein [Dehalogenimonas sp. 4OHTPN]|uniref:IPT/TIG domain-containing protein n=1 Tax=Dehalogenimonas sp. 4OHTPN TaxID=3166643 RepID=A0AAU8GBV4_9CHLR
MRLKIFLRTLPIMLITALLGIGALAAPVGAAGTITQTITPTSGSPAITQVSIAGTGFAPGAYTILFNATVVNSGTIPAGGALNVTFVVPALPKGAYAVTVDDSSADPAVAAGTFTVNQTILTSVANAPIGATVTVNGYGFNPNVAVNVYFGALTTPVAQVTSLENTNGSFSKQFLVPQAPRANYFITATDAFTTPASANILFAVTPRITAISAETGGVGDTVTINGDGFTALGSVSFFFDSDTTTALTTVTANASGIIPATTITIPTAARGVHTIIVRDNTATAISVTRLYTINVSKITVSPTSGQVGTSVTISGNGFNSGGVIDFEFDGAAFTGVTSITAAANGTFTKTAVIIPTTSAGAHTITARVTSDPTVFANATFTVNSRIVITPTTGTAGTTVTITGSGFSPAGVMSFTYDATPLASSPATPTIQANGTFSAQVVIPGAAAATHTIYAVDGMGNVATASFISTITATLTPLTNTLEPGFVGQEITAAGTGFMPNSTVTIRLGNTPMGSVVANATGTFSIKFKIDAIPAGAYVIFISDGTTTKQFDYIMEGNAPAAPTLVTPARDAKAEQPVVFDWNDVSDPSGVTYTLEVALDSSFTKLALKKDGLTSSKYTMTEAEKLETVPKKAPYYWRVIARDGAGNVGAAGSAFTFTVGFSLEDIPMWAWITGGFFVVVIVGGLLYYFTRRRSMY